MPIKVIILLTHMYGDLRKDAAVLFLVVSDYTVRPTDVAQHQNYYYKQ